MIKNSKCPKCGISDDVIKIVYGKPIQKLINEAK
jgi:hypothetical protein